ncbi:MAG TPA: hypothetical protein VK970_10400 [Candidatus Methylacidiphilales bacterium]|nr:hypothetical protein [Candidatus Methylacidiphilales bacterium]
MTHSESPLSSSTHFFAASSEAVASPASTSKPTLAQTPEAKPVENAAPLNPDASAHAEAVAAEQQQEGQEGKRPRKRLSTAMGAACLAGGVLGLAVPLLPGWPLLIIGASVLAPTVPILSRASKWMEERFPDVAEGALDFEHRFMTDFEKRYPDAPAAATAAVPAEATKDIAAPGTTAEAASPGDSDAAPVTGQK